MPIPDYQSIMLPLLRLLGNRQERSIHEAIEILADEFKLSEDERKELLASGQQRIFDNRVGWARTYMKKAGLIEYTGRGRFKISERGLNVISNNPPVINNKFLEQFQEYLEFKTRTPQDKKDSEEKPELLQTPKELIEEGYQKIRQSLTQELLNQIMRSSPAFFEQLVVDLLVKMGYGGSRKDAGRAIGKSGDEGIDGIINEDILGLDNIYIQAKRWEVSIGRGEIQKFVGALQGKRANKGVFITTSTFKTSALDYVRDINTKVILIDGETLAQYMVDNNVGVSIESVYEVKKIDSDYFDDN